MAEEKNVPVPEENKQGTERPESELLAELERIRSRNKVLKAAAAILAVLFMALATAAFVAYRKISQAKNDFVNALQSYQPPASGSQAEGMPLPGSFPSVLQSTSMASSGLGLISGSIPGSQLEASSVEDAGKILGVISKYSDRPIIKEFMADLKKDPQIARALAENKNGNPMGIFAAIQKAPGANAIVAKYATRPDFLKVLMEAMKDPDMKPIMSKIHMGGGMPQVVPVAAGPAEEPRQEEESGGLTLDPTAMDVPAAAAPAKAAPARARKVPPPVDTE